MYVPVIEAAVPSREQEPGSPFDREIDLGYTDDGCHVLRYTPIVDGHFEHTDGPRGNGTFNYLPREVARRLAQAGARVVAIATEEVGDLRTFCAEVITGREEAIMWVIELCDGTAGTDRTVLLIDDPGLVERDPIDDGVRETYRRALEILCESGPAEGGVCVVSRSREGSRRGGNFAGSYVGEVAFHTRCLRLEERLGGDMFKRSSPEKHGAMIHAYHTYGGRLVDDGYRRVIVTFK